MASIGRGDDGVSWNQSAAPDIIQNSDLQGSSSAMFGLDRLQAGLTASRSSIGSLIRRLSSSGSSGRRVPATGAAWQTPNEPRGEFNERTIADSQTSALLDGYDDVYNGDIDSHPRGDSETHAHASIASGYARTPPSYSQSSPLRRAG